jgi:hypothetical protein
MIDPRVVVALGCAAMCMAARADTTEAPFAMRVFLAVDRQSNHATTLGRQASLASPDASSLNPAGAGFSESRGSTSVSAAYVDARTQSGRRFSAAPLTARWPLGAGTLGAAYAYTDTPTQRGSDGFDRALRSHELTAGYGWRARTDVAFGASARLVTGRILDAQPAADASVPAVRVSSKFDGVDFAAGAMAVVSPQVSAGAVIVAAWTAARSTVTTLSPFVIATPVGPVVVPPGTGLDDFADRIRLIGARAGLGYRARPDVAVYADASHLRISSDRFESTATTRVAIGVEYSPAEGWSLRSGVGLDNNRQTTWSAGAAARLTRNVEAQLAFQSNAAPELNPELGRMRLIVTSIAVRM